MKCGSNFQELSDFLLVFDGDVLEAFFDNLFVVLFIVDVLVVVCDFHFLKPVGWDFVYFEDFEVEIEDTGLVLLVFEYGGDGLKRVVGELLLDGELHHVLHFILHET